MQIPLEGTQFMPLQISNHREPIPAGTSPVPVDRRGGMSQRTNLLLQGWKPSGRDIHVGQSGERVASLSPSDGGGHAGAGYKPSRSTRYRQ